MSKKLVTVAALLLAMVLNGFGALAAPGAEGEKQWNPNQQYFIYCGDKNTALYDNGGSREGWLCWGKYDYTDKYKWTLQEAGDGNYYLYNVGTGYPVKQDGKSLHQNYGWPAYYVVSDKNLGYEKGAYRLEQTQSGRYLIKSVTCSHSGTSYLSTDQKLYNRNYAIYSGKSDSVEWTLAPVEGNEEFPRPEGSRVLWYSPVDGAEPGTKDYYRIPVIATTNNGDLLAVADLRYKNNVDLGNWGDSTRYGHQIDLLLKRSVDNGRGWSEADNLTQGHSYPGTSYYRLANGYGDGALVADRDSDKVLLLCASGGTRYGTPNGSNKLQVSVLRSDDNGVSFRAPTNITEDIYGLDRRWSSLFFASGRIMQSRYVKVKDYYRIYTALLSLRHGNYVAYSDDFGETWRLLGNSGSPVSDGDEAKMEELPNGDVLIASRSQNGRLFNIFHYEKGKEAEAAGTWERKQQVNFGKAQATNGETYVVYAYDKEEKRYTYVILQSVPTLNGKREGVGIFYKELENKEGMTVDDFIQGWSKDQFYMVQELTSAYSTMTVQKDGSIGFLYEEREAPGYDITYLNLKLSTITKGRYEMAFQGIGSAKCPYEVETAEQAMALAKVYNREGVHWNLSDTAKEALKVNVGEIAFRAPVKVGYPLVVEEPTMESIVDMKESGWQIAMPGSDEWTEYDIHKAVTEELLGARIRFKALNRFSEGTSNELTIEKEFIPVQGIAGIPAEIMVKGVTTVKGQVFPADADKQEIVYEVVKGMATVSGGDAVETMTSVGSIDLIPESQESIVLKVTVKDGLAEGTDYVQEYAIRVTENPEFPLVPVREVEGIPQTIQAGEEVSISGKALPEEATNKSLKLEVTQVGKTGARVEAVSDSDLKVKAENAGIITVKATVENGVAWGLDWTAYFYIYVEGEQGKTGGESQAPKAEDGKPAPSTEAHSAPAAWAWNPATLEEKERAGFKAGPAPVFTYKTANTDAALTITNEMQGERYIEAVKALLAGKKSPVKGYKIAHTYNVLPEGNQSGTRYETVDSYIITLTIPQELRRENRSFAMIVLDETGRPYVHKDEDKNKDTITFTTNHFYAYTLVYMDK